jgi:hypothetical protein
VHDPSSLDPERVRLLDECGFLWDPVLGTWFNMNTHRAISFAAVRDSSIEWLCGWLEGATGLPVARKP